VKRKKQATGYMDRALNDARIELDDSIIKQAMDIVAAQSPGVLQGLQDPLLPAAKALDDSSGFQFGTNGRVSRLPLFRTDHWIFSCELPHVVGQPQGEVAVFDSLRTSTALSNPTVKRNLFDIAYGASSLADSLRVIKRAGQIQTGSTQCGDFAIAWMVAFAHGDDLDILSRTKFNQAVMRTHLHDCLAAGKFTRFPTTSAAAEYSREQTVTLTR